MTVDSRIPKVMGYVEALVDRKSQLLIEDEQLKERQSMHGPMTTLMEHLSEKVVSQSKGLYSELLTAIVLDVMDDQDQHIELEASMSSRNRPEVMISSVKKGVKEDIVRNRGGSINNLVSAGLRIIALALSGNRRFVMLDEADCWLRGDLIPKFAQVLGRLSAEMGIQCVYISHHDPDIFRDHGNVVELYQGLDGISFRCLPAYSTANLKGVNHRMNGDLLDSHITSISLDNIANYKGFSLPLGPGLTILAGENDLGKSAIVHAVEALITGSNSTHLIKHGETIGHITLGLEENLTLNYALASRKGAGATYSLIRDGRTVLKNEEIKRNDEVPGWVNSLLAMPMTGDLNLHIGNQTDSLFLLNPAYSAQKRAELIDLGEGYYQFSMLSSQYAKDQRECKQRRSYIAQELDQLNDRLEFYRPVELVNALAQKMVEIETARLSAESDLSVIANYMDGLEGSLLLSQLAQLDARLTGVRPHNDSMTTLDGLVATLDACGDGDLAILLAKHKAQMASGEMGEHFKSSFHSEEILALAHDLEQSFVQEDVLHVLVDKAAVLASQICGLESIADNVRDVMMMANVLEDAQVYRDLHSQIRVLSEIALPGPQGDPLAAASELLQLEGEIGRYHEGLLAEHCQLNAIAEHKNHILDKNGGVCPVCHGAGLGRGG